MKNYFFALALIFSAGFLPAQNTTTMQLTEHTIAVTGIGELDIVPDEIYMNVTIEEFTKDKKKYTIEELESAFLNFLEKTTSTPRTDVKMDNTDAAIIAMKRKQKDAIIEKTYEVKFKNTDQVNMLFISEDSLHLEQVYVKRYSSSKLNDYKKQVRISAMTDAKDKATYLLDVVGSKPGKPISVAEVNPAVDMEGAKGTTSIGYFFGGRPVDLSNYDSEDEDYISSYDPIQKTIKLKYAVNVIFAID